MFNKAELEDIWHTKPVGWLKQNYKAPRKGSAPLKKYEVKYIQVLEGEGVSVSEMVLARSHAKAQAAASAVLYDKLKKALNITTYAPMKYKIYTKEIL